MSRLERMRQAALEAASRRRRLAVWLEHFEAMNRTPTRSLEEARAKQEALELLRQGYPR